MTTAIIGVGNIGGTVARQLASGGEPVLFSATSSDKVQKLAGEIGTPATAALDNRDAVQRADAVILALSLDPMKVVIDEVADLLPGKLVIDPSNPIAIAAEGTVSRTLPDGQSAGGVVARWLTQAPRYRRLVATRALAQLQFPPDWAVRELADALREACHDPQIRILVDQAVDQALAGSIAAAATAMAVLATWEQDGGGFAMTARQRLERLLGELDPRQRRCLAPLAWVYPDGPLRALATASDPNRKTREHTLASLVRVHLRTAGVDAETTKAVGVLLEQLAKVYLGPQFHHSALYDITYHGTLFDDGGALSDPRVLDVVVPAIEELARQNWHAAGALRSVLATWLARRPAGDRLSEPG
jgi:ketopantoate reductase